MEICWTLRVNLWRSFVSLDTTIREFDNLSVKDQSGSDFEIILQCSCCSLSLLCVRPRIQFGLVPIVYCSIHYLCLSQCDLVGRLGNSCAIVRQSVLYFSKKITIQYSRATVSDINENKTGHFHDFLSCWKWYISFVFFIHSFVSSK